MNKKILTALCILMVLSFSGVTSASGADLPGAAQFSQVNRCYAVQGSIHQTLNEDGILAGSISGDLVGNIITLGGPTEFHGVVMMGDIVQYWEITGGEIEGLIGSTLVFENRFRGILNDYPMVIVNTTAKLVEGAESGNITLHGWTSLAPVIENYLEYHGEICPQ